MSELGERVDAANREAVRRMLEAAPTWNGVVRARHVVTGLGEREVCLAGPAVGWEAATAAQRRAVIEAVLFEGWADDEEGAAALVEEGGVTLGSAADRGGATPAALAVSPSTPVLCVEDRPTARRVWAALDATTSTGAARALDTTGDRLARRVFLRDALGPALDRAVDVAGSIELLPLLAHALHRGDDLGARTDALQTLVASELSRHLVRAGIPRGELGLVLDDLARGSTVAAALALGAARSIADAATGVPWSTIVTAMGQGGRSFGLRVAGLGRAWVTVRLDGASLVDEDLGDRPLAECVGLGAFAMPAAPALLAAYRTSDGAIADRVLAMRSITATAHPRLTVPLLGFEGVRVGIDVRRVVETGLEPLVAIEDVVRGPRVAPLAAFAAALEAFAEAAGIGDGGGA